MTKRSKKTGRFIRSRHRTSTRRRTRGGRRTESWSKRGRIKVRRNRKGQFVTWHKVRRYTRGKTARRKWKTAVSHRATRPFGFGKHVILRGKWKGKNKEIEKTERGNVLKDWVMHEMSKAMHGEGWDAKPQILSQ